MNIELSELGRHEAWLRVSSIMKVGDKQIQLERKLTSALLKNWRESYETALKEWIMRSCNITRQRFDKELNCTFAETDIELVEYIQQSRGADEVTA